MKLSFVIVNYNVDGEVVSCINSIESKIDIKSYEIIIVDNSPKKTLYRKIRQIKNLKYIQNDENVGYGQACNIGAKRAIGEYLFILNPDTRLVEGSIKKALSLFKNMRIGAIAPYLIVKGNREKYQGTKILTPLRAIFSLSFLGRIFPNNWIRKDYYLYSTEGEYFRECEILPGTAFIISRKSFQAIKGFDSNFFLYFEEFDLFKRFREKGFTMYITKDLKLLHKWGESTKKINNVSKLFQQSRYYYFKKNYSFTVAFLTEIILRIKPVYIILALILVLALFLRLFRLSETMIFLGDQGWFYLSAYDLISTGKIPLVGIPSSVTWLHQGPLATYLIGSALLIGKMNPITPALLFTFLDIFTILFIFISADKLFNKWVGLLSGFFYATSPLVLISARTPYHTSAVPFFMSILFLLIAYFDKKRSKLFFFLIFLIVGLLLQLELSNAVIIFFVVVLYFAGILKLMKKDLVPSLFGFFVGISPFIIFDITHRFVQTLGFPLWVVNRIRLFFGITLNESSTISNSPVAFDTVINQISAIYSPNTKYILFGFILLFLIVFFINKKPYIKNFIIIILSIILPLFSFFIHSAPGVAYFPLIFVPLALLTGYIFYIYSKKIKFFFLILIFIMIWGSFQLITNEFYITTKTGTRILPVNAYSYGFSYKAVVEAAEFIKEDANGEPVRLKGMNLLAKFPASLDNLRYILITNGVSLSESGKLYYIFSGNDKVINPDFINYIYKIKK